MSLDSHGRADATNHCQLRCRDHAVGGLFRGKVLETTAIGGRQAVIPEVTGSAFVTSYHQFVIDSEDPFAQGFEMQ